MANTLNVTHETSVAAVKVFNTQARRQERRAEQRNVTMTQDTVRKCAQFADSMVKSQFGFTIPELFEIA